MLGAVDGDADGHGLAVGRCHVGHVAAPTAGTVVRSRPAVVVGASEEDVASVDDPPEQADRVPSATSALIPTSRVRRSFFM